MSILISSTAFILFKQNVIFMFKSSFPSHNSRFYQALVLSFDQTFFPFRIIHVNFGHGFSFFHFIFNKKQQQDYTFVYPFSQLRPISDNRGYDSYRNIIINIIALINTDFTSCSIHAYEMKNLRFFSSVLFSLNFAPS